MRVRKVFVIGILCGLTLVFPLSASSFALRNMEKGAKGDDIEYTGITVESGKLSSFMGEKGLIVIYWATWSSRSPAILEFAEKSLRRYEKLGLKLLAVNADHVDMKAEDVAAVKAKAAELGISFPVVLDAGLKGYNAIGIISTPTMPVMRPPVRKEILPGAMFAKSFAGDTTFAAMFTASVATTTVNIEIATSSGDVNCPTSSIGSHIALP